MQLKDFIKKIELWDEWAETEEGKNIIPNGYDCRTFDRALADDEGFDDEEKKLFTEKTGLEFEFLHSKRVNSELITRFKLDGRIFEQVGNYSSWDGTDVGSYRDMEEVEEYEKVIKAYRQVK